MKYDPQLDHVVNFMIEQTARQFKQYCQKQFDVQGINITIDQWVILKIIHQEKELTQAELASIAKKDNASITRMLDLIEKRKLITRTEHATDRRKYRLKLTKEGNAFVIQNMPLVNQLRMKTIEGLSSTEVRQLKNILEKIRKNTE